MASPRSSNPAAALILTLLPATPTTSLKLSRVAPAAWREHRVLSNPPPSTCSPTAILSSPPSTAIRLPPPSLTAPLSPINLPAPIRGQAVVPTPLTYTWTPIPTPPFPWMTTVAVTRIPPSVSVTKLFFPPPLPAPPPPYMILPSTFPHEKGLYYHRTSNLHGSSGRTHHYSGHCSLPRD